MGNESGGDRESGTERKRERKRETERERAKVKGKRYWEGERQRYTDYYTETTE